LANWPAVEAECLRLAGVTLRDIDLVAATRGPGLIGALLVGLSLGRALAYGLGRPFHAVHHLEGHLYSPFLRAPGEPAAPVPERFTGLVVSGGHSNLYQVVDSEITTLAETRDDALGEVFDKVGKRLGLPYPQGPRVDELAERGEAPVRAFRIAACTDGSLDFSYSGLKSQALQAIEILERQGVECRLDEGDEPPPELLDLLAGFRASAVGQVLDRVVRLHAREPIEILAVSGGAAANRLLRRELTRWAAEREVDLRLVPLAWSGDNAAMIAWAGLLRERRGLRDDPMEADAAGRIALGAR
jgi:N6-L-threonylcarbamoyladenine synthase